ncbi:SH3 domain-containing protein [Oricola sp.]|uniref:SH3 domain-containing protein n=1 Tax=Oricola sp. TaxID=1979950 RepID=UPI0025E76195|nr:SH3 domain-containing protein [Oricola sp.]MCI5073548.1 SH3 domain-containing protein [Oricola sp.]
MKLKSIPIALAVTVAALATSLPSKASVFHAWEVTNVPWGDVLNVRRWPASYSQIESAYPNGTVLSLTGRCKGGLMLDDIAHLTDWQKRQVVRYKWCEVWHDPANSGQWQTGWVYMRYMRPH